MHSSLDSSVCIEMPPGNALSAPRPTVQSAEKVVQELNRLRSLINRCEAVRPRTRASSSLSLIPMKSFIYPPSFLPLLRCQRTSLSWDSLEVAIADLSAVRQSRKYSSPIAERVEEAPRRFALRGTDIFRSLSGRGGSSSRRRTRLVQRFCSCWGAQAHNVCDGVAQIRRRT